MQTTKLKLGVNIDHVATLRQARGTSYPDPLEAARLCEQAGAHGITAHLREDRRHIQDEDVRRLRRELRLPLNLEMANAPAIVAIAAELSPAEACLVPEKRRELTTEGGLDAVAQLDALRETTRRLSDAGTTVSFFLDPEPRQIEAAAAAGAPCIELHTGTYCLAVEADDRAAAAEQDRLVRAAQQAHELGLRVNAGHGLNLENVSGIFCVPYLDTLNIGHSIVAHAVYVGLGTAVKAMLTMMTDYHGGQRG